MNKLGKREYVKLIAETLSHVYGETLKQHNTDVEMAEAVVGVLKEFLYFDKMDINYQEFRKWKKERQSDDFNPNWVSAPGETISSILEERHVPKEFFAKQINKSLKFVDDLLVGNVKINAELAEKLAQVLGATKKFWMKREEIYQEGLK